MIVLPTKFLPTEEVLSHKDTLIRSLKHMNVASVGNGTL